jgi:hypothetical protein
MSHYPQTSACRGANLLIESEWTPEQAYAVFQLLDDLRDRILSKDERPLGNRCVKSMPVKLN